MFRILWFMLQSIFVRLRFRKTRVHLHPAHTHPQHKPHLFLHTHTHTRTDTRTHTRTHTLTYSHTHTYTYTYTHTYVHVCLLHFLKKFSRNKNVHKVYFPATSPSSLANQLSPYFFGPLTLSLSCSLARKH